MAITKNITSSSTLPDGELSPTSSSYDDEEILHSDTSSSGTDNGFSEADSGMGSDICDLSELGDAGSEFCQVGKQTCCVPVELYDLPNLLEILSLDSWNDVLSEEERVALSEFLPDIDQETFVRTITELLSGANFYHSSPVEDLFARLKGGLCEPRIVLGRRASNLLQKRRHYHYLRRYQNDMVDKLFHIRNAWQKCKGYSIEEKLHSLKLMKKKEKYSLVGNGDVGSATDLESEDSGERAGRKTLKIGQSSWPSKPSHPKGVLKVAAPKRSVKKGYHLGFSRNQLPVDDEDGDNDGSGQGCRSLSRSSLLKTGTKQQFLKKNDKYSGLPRSFNKKKNSDEGTPIAAYAPLSKKFRYPEHELPLHKAHVELSNSEKSTSDDKQIRAKKLKAVGEFSSEKAKLGSELMAKSYESSPDQYYSAENRGHITGDNIKSNFVMDGGGGMGYLRNDMVGHNEKTESNSSDEDEEVEDVKQSVRKLKPSHNIKKSSKFSKKDAELHGFHFGGRSSSDARDLRTYFLKTKEKGKPNGSTYERGDFKKMQMSEKLKTGSRTYSEKKRRGATDLDHLSYVAAQKQSSPPDGVYSTETYKPETDIKLTSNMSLLTCNSISKKRKVKLEDVYRDNQDEAAYQEASSRKQVDDVRQIKKKGKRNADAVLLSSCTSDQTMPRKTTTDVELETKIEKKPYTPITPTVHTGFSFSIIHLLSAIRKALTCPCLEDKQNRGAQVANDTNINTTRHARQDILPSLTVQEIVNRVRSNPGDPCILETQEPLQDLVRGVLKIFSSKTAPLGAKGWKALVSYEKSTKKWFWVGAVALRQSDNDVVEEETSAEAWCIPHKMLVKLVDAFANWLKSGQETLQQIGSLPPPPPMPTVLHEKERFKELKAQKSLHTISPCSDEVRAYIRKEEFLRYSIPDRAFSYTALDGKKSIVAPLRRGGGKPTTKARDHFMLKPDRPPHVTILCLVRDAAARLPASIGTRADVCTLLRDSQYIVEDVADAQVNQVVSGALDRLHYERDPCVQYDNDRKLWVYLHRDREVEDFEDDGTSSTKKWKRQKKDATENSDMDAANDSAPGYDFNADLNVDAGGKKAERVYSDIRPNVDIESTSNNEDNAIDWKVLRTDPLHENKMLCQENSANEDLEEAYCSKRRSLVSASLL